MKFDSYTEKMGNHPQVLLTLSQREASFFTHYIDEFLETAGTEYPLSLVRGETEDFSKAVKDWMIKKEEDP